MANQAQRTTSAGMANVERLPIEGVLRVHPKSFGDDRGSFVEFFRQEWLPGDRPMLQANISRSRAGVLRGMHWHRRQADYWFYIQGSAFVGLYDLRAGSSTQGVGLGVDMSGEDGSGLYVPPGVAHGFCALTDVTMEYLVDAYFTGEDENGVAWDDPDLGIEWPVKDPIVSDRDSSNPSLRNTLLDPPRFRPTA
jgi:dTDP-4-dehydrorhamnose 3,5-epimerase